MENTHRAEGRIQVSWKASLEKRAWTTGRPAGGAGGNGGNIEIRTRNKLVTGAWQTS